MLKYIYRLLGAAMAAFTGAFVGMEAFELWDRMNRPEFYAMQSAPWYVGLLLRGAVTVLVVLAAWAARRIMRHHIAD